MLEEAFLFDKTVVKIVQLSNGERMSKPKKFMQVSSKYVHSTDRIIDSLNMLKLELFHQDVLDSYLQFCVVV